MDAALSLWLLGGVLVALVMMLVIVMIARALERDRQAETAAVARMIDMAKDAAAKHKNLAGLAAVTGPIAALIAASQSNEKKEGESADTPKQKQMKSLMTGLAVAGGLLMLIVGIITGDG